MKLYCMIDETVNSKRHYKIVPIINISGTCLTDINNNKYNIEKVKYVWQKRTPIENPDYVGIHLIEEKNKIDIYV